VLEMAPKQRQVDLAFILISKEEREMDIEREFVALSDRIGRQAINALACTLLWHVDVVGA
jgi:hypothetical protein